LVSGLILTRGNLISKSKRTILEKIYLTGDGLVSIKRELGRGKSKRVSLLASSKSKRGKSLMKK
jgi:hypothetical protein